MRVERGDWCLTAHHTALNNARVCLWCRAFGTWHFGACLLPLPLLPVITGPAFFLLFWSGRGAHEHQPFGYRSVSLYRLCRASLRRAMPSADRVHAPHPLCLQIPFRIRQAAARAVKNERHGEKQIEHIDRYSRCAGFAGEQTNNAVRSRSMWRNAAPMDGYEQTCEPVGDAGYARRVEYGNARQAPSRVPGWRRTTRHARGAGMANLARAGVRVRIELRAAAENYH